ncbi:MAG: 50S ribosomal protein L10, partial [Cytophagales bacterium]|nr:50S ribosomal protein L10 [Cytophagales bacterium]
MTRAEKAQIIDDLTEKFKNNSNFYIANTSGLSVAEVNDFRRKCFSK